MLIVKDDIFKSLDIILSLFTHFLKSIIIIAVIKIKLIET